MKNHTTGVKAEKILGRYYNESNVSIMVSRDGNEVMNHEKGFERELTKFTDRFGCGWCESLTQNNRIWP